jgi:NAD(P)-dependent dehydrogenase (short-subunit alcohol dehydrogenase family)
VTKAFAPLIIESKGRITTTGSVSGIIAGVLYGPYSMSKHAVEAFTDSLAAEMSKFDVQVSIIEPGNYNSAIVESKVRRMQERGRTPDGSLYKDELEALLRAPTDRSVYKEPDDVSAAMMHFLFDEHPKRRYLVVPSEQTAEATIRTMIAELVQLNERHAYSYDRETLIGMLDEALEASEK